jgi:hypothetical protein
VDSHTTSWGLTTEDCRSVSPCSRWKSRPERARFQISKSCSTVVKYRRRSDTRGWPSKPATETSPGTSIPRSARPSGSPTGRPILSGITMGTSASASCNAAYQPSVQPEVFPPVGPSMWWMIRCPCRRYSVTWRPPAASSINAAKEPSARTDSPPAATTAHRPEPVALRRLRPRSRALCRTRGHLAQLTPRITDGVLGGSREGFSPAASAPLLLEES